MKPEEFELACVRGGGKFKKESGLYYCEIGDVRLRLEPDGSISFDDVDSLLGGFAL